MDKIQIDVIKRVPNAAHLFECNLYANGIVVKIFMHEIRYAALIESGFFIRDGKSIDSANILNTTNVYRKEVKND